METLTAEVVSTPIDQEQQDRINSRLARFGERRSIGRPAGVPNKATQSVKAALTAAFEGLGGVPALIEWGQKDPSVFYALWGKLLPKEISGPDGGPLSVEHKVVVKWGGVEIPL